jgi:hypothetical protein
MDDRLVRHVDAEDHRRIGTGGSGESLSVAAGSSTGQS